MFSLDLLTNIIKMILSCILAMMVITAYTNCAIPIFETVIAAGEKLSWTELISLQQGPVKWSIASMKMFYFHYADIEQLDGLKHDQ